MPAWLLVKYQQIVWILLGRPLVFAERGVAFRLKLEVQQLDQQVFKLVISVFMASRCDVTSYIRPYPYFIADCQNQMLNSSSGVIESPNFPDSYPNSRNCTWMINAPLGNILSLRFSHFEIEGDIVGSACRNDFLEVCRIWVLCVAVLWLAFCVNPNHCYIQAFLFLCRFSYV